MSTKTERETTPNYGLVKPKQTDFYNVNDFNENMDKIDEQIKANADDVEVNWQQIVNLLSKSVATKPMPATFDKTKLYTWVENGVYLTDVSGIVDLPTGWPQGRHCVIVAHPDNAAYGIQFITPYEGSSGESKRFAFRNSIREGSQWREVTTKDITDSLSNQINVLSRDKLDKTSNLSSKDNLTLPQDFAQRLYQWTEENFCGIGCNGGGAFRLRVGTSEVAKTVFDVGMSGYATLNGKQVATTDKTLIKGGVSDGTGLLPSIIYKGDTPAEPKETLYQNGNMEMRVPTGHLPAIGFHTVGISACALYEKQGALHTINNAGYGGKISLDTKVPIVFTANENVTCTYNNSCQINNVIYVDLIVSCSVVLEPSIQHRLGVFNYTPVQCKTLSAMPIGETSYITGTGCNATLWTDSSIYCIFPQEQLYPVRTVSVQGVFTI